MPRHPDPGLEERILCAADVLWKRGGEKSLTMRAVARAAGTNTPAVYRRFKNRQDLLRGLLRRIVVRIRQHFAAGKTVEAMAEAYVEYALQRPREYELFYSHSRELSPPKGPGRPRPIRESRPNFAFLEQRLAQQLGGSPKDHTRLSLELWALAHGTAMLLISKSIPEGHEEELRKAQRVAVKALLDAASQSASRSERRSASRSTPRS
jgi:AcrR family transcriptional regulator